MKFQNFTLDTFQEEAIHALEDGHSVLVSAPTGSGKTLIADYLIEKALKEGKNVAYTAPIKALSNQKYKDFVETYGKEKIGLLTGDEVINESAPVRIMTTEIYRNMALLGEIKADYAIFDEVHFINDIERGTVWEESFIFSPDRVRYVCLSATIPNAQEFAKWIESIRSHHMRVILHDKRHVPLKISFYDEELGVTSLEKIKDAVHITKIKRKKVDFPNHLHLVDDIQTPSLFFCFSRKNCERNAIELAKSRKGIDHDIAKMLATKMKGLTKFQSAKILREILPKRIGFHHAGLLPQLKVIVEELFEQGKIDVLYTTETFAVGINMPAKTVCFESLTKFNGRHFTYLNSKEFFQMAGRAGRRGKDKKGFVIPMINRKKFDYQIIKNFTSKDVDPLKSQFRLSPSTALNLFDQHSKKEVEKILKNSFYLFQKKKKYAYVKRSFENHIRKLKKLEYIIGDQLTTKGIFCANLFADEIVLTEIFTGKWEELSIYEIVLLLATIVYEPRPGNRFYEMHYEDLEIDLVRKFRDVFDTSQVKHMSALIYPIFQGKDFFAVTKNTTLDEGDLMRFYNQILDRMNQLFRAITDEELIKRMEKAQKIIEDFIDI